MVSALELAVKSLPANTGNIKMRVQSLGQEDPLEKGMATHSRNPMDRGAWRATVYSVAKSQTRPKRLSTHTHT